MDTLQVNCHSSDEKHAKTMTFMRAGQKENKIDKNKFGKITKKENMTNGW